MAVAGLVSGAASFVMAGPVVTPRVEAVAVTTVTTHPPPVTTTIAPVTTTIAPRPVVIHGVGDVNFDPRYIRRFVDDGYGIAFAGMDGLFRFDDVTVINLECSPSDSGVPIDKDYIFRCDPAALAFAAEAGVEVANLANNHGQDYGPTALLDGIENLNRTGMFPVGVGENLVAATSPALFEVETHKVAVLGFGGVHPASSWLATSEAPGMADGDDIDQMVSAVSSAAKLADIVVVSIHWGTELVTEPSQSDRAAAEAMIAAGADVIFGHHPHRLGELEWIAGRPVFWTLGNFVWPRLSDAGATTGVGRVVISGDSVIACIVPAFIESDGAPVLRGEPRCDGE